MPFRRFFRSHKPTIEDIEAMQDEVALKLVYDHTKQLSREVNEHFRGFFSARRKSPRIGEQQVRLQQHGNIVMAYDEAGNPCGTLHLPQTVAHAPQGQPTVGGGGPIFPNGYVPYPQWKDMHGGPESPLARPETAELVGPPAEGARLVAHPEQRSRTEEPKNGSELHPAYLQTSSPSLFWHIPTPPNELLSQNILATASRSFNLAQTPEPDVTAHPQMTDSPNLGNAAHSVRSDEEVRPVPPIAIITQEEASFLPPLSLPTSPRGLHQPYSLQPVPPEPYLPERPWPTTPNMFAEALRSDTTRNSQLSQPNALPGLPSPSPRRLPMSWLRDRITTRKTDPQGQQGNDILQERTPAPGRSASGATNDASGARDRYASNWIASRAWNMTMCTLLQNHLKASDPRGDLREVGNGTSTGTAVGAALLGLAQAHSNLENALSELGAALERGEHTPLRELDNMRGYLQEQCYEMCRPRTLEERSAFFWDILSHIQAFVSAIPQPSGSNSNQSETRMDSGIRTEGNTVDASATGLRREEANNAGDRAQVFTAPLSNENVSSTSMTSHRLSYADLPPQSRLSHRNPAEFEGPGMNHDDDSPELHGMSMVQTPPRSTVISNANQRTALDSPVRTNVELQHPRPLPFIRLSSLLSQLSPRLTSKKNL